MVGVKVSAEGFTELLGRLPSAAQNQQTLHGIINRSRLIVQSHVMRDAPVKTGMLRRSLNSEMTGPIEGRVGSSVRYAPYVELGTRPHPIFARHADALKFVPKELALYGRGGTVRLTGRARTIGGRQVNVSVLRKSVHHPGTQANEFMRRGFEESMSEIGQTVEAAARSIVNDGGGEA